MMSATLLKEPAPPSVTHYSAKRVAEAQLSAIAVQLRSILLEDNAFKKWEADAIVEIVVDALKNDQKLNSNEWQLRLHAKGFPKEFAEALAEKLSDK